MYLTVSLVVDSLVIDHAAYLLDDINKVGSGLPCTIRTNCC